MFDQKGETVARASELRGGDRSFHEGLSSGKKIALEEKGREER